MIRRTTLLFIAINFLTACGTTLQKDTADHTMKTLTSLYDFQLIDSKTRKPLSVSELAKKSQGQDVIFIGEIHSHQASHFLQLQFLEAMFRENPNIVLSMEQFSRDNQDVLNKYLDGEYGEKTLIKEGAGWDHYKGSYRALVDFARENNIPVIAANAPIMHVRCMGRRGLEVLDNIPEEQADWSAKNLNLDIKQYKEKFFSFMNQAGRAHGQEPEEQKARMMKSYAAQLLRDTTMAESIHNALKNNKGATVIHLDGAFHSDNHLGTVAVLNDMATDLKVIVLSPVMLDSGEFMPPDDAVYKQGEYLYLLKSLPEPYVNKEKRNEGIRELIKERMKEECAL